MDSPVLTLQIFKLNGLDLIDDHTPEVFLRQLKLYIEEQSREKNHFDPKICPLEGYLARLATEDTGIRAPELISADWSDSEDEQRNPLSAMQHATTEWRPVHGNIKILTRGTAESIVALTKTELLPEPIQNLVRLVNGDFDAALGKLRNLESLMTLQYQQRHHEANQANSSILITTDDARKPLLGFQKVNFELCPAYSRILVHPQDAHDLAGKYVCEGRVMQDGVRRPHPHLDPTNIGGPGSVQRFMLWDDYECKEAGETANMEPIANTCGSRESNSVPQPEPQKYLAAAKAAIVAGWADAIHDSVDPNTAAPDFPVEPTTKRRRKVAVDSDDEDDVADIKPTSADTGGELEGACETQETTDESPMDDKPVIRTEAGGKDTPVTDADVQSDFDRRLLSELSIQSTRRAPTTSQTTPPIDLLKDDEPVISFPTDLPAELAKHFGLGTEQIEADHAHVTQSEAPAPRQHLTSVISQDYSPRDNDPLISTLGSAVGQQYSAPFDLLFSQTQTVPEVSPHSSNVQNIMDDDQPLTSPQNSQLSSTYSVAEPTDDVNSKFHVNHTRYQGRNMEVLRREHLEKHSAQASQRNKGKSKQSHDTRSTVSSGRGKPKKGRGGHQQRQAEDTKPPRFRQTMSQTAGNPGKKRGGKQGANSAADKARKQKAIEEAYGVLPQPQSGSGTDSGANTPDLTKKTQSLLSTNAALARLHGESLQQQHRQKEIEQLTSRLNPLFECVRASSGHVDFAIHFGQVLLSTDPQASKTKSFDNKAWEEVFGSNARYGSPGVSFTSMMTTNGADLDSVLQMNAPLRGLGKLWDRTTPGQSKLTYEFSCLSKTGDTFVLVLNEDKTYEIRTPVETIGSVCMQCPAQVWDACASLQGAEFCQGQSQEMLDTIQGFVDSIYIEPKYDLNLYFRQPVGNVVTVNNPQMKRISLHQCLLPDYENYHLRIAEVVNLYTRVSPRDKKLWKAQEHAYDDMVRSHNIYYEMAIIDTTITEALEANKTLEVGELTDEATTGKSLLKGLRLKPMLELAVLMLTKIDFVGSHNIGTLRRREEARQLQEQSAPPNLRSTIQPYRPASRVPVSAMMSGLGSTPDMTASGLVVDALKSVHGTRMNTRAEIMVDNQGSLFQKGLGGANVPVVQSGLHTISEAPLEPGDSASQYGGPRHNRGMGNGVRQPWEGPADTRGPGFW